MTLPQTAQHLAALLRKSAQAPPRTPMQHIADMKAKRGERCAVARFWEGLAQPMRDNLRDLARRGSGDCEMRFYVHRAAADYDQQAVWILSQDPEELAGWLVVGVAGLSS